MRPSRPISWSQIALFCVLAAGVWWARQHASPHVPAVQLPGALVPSARGPGAHAVPRSRPGGTLGGRVISIADGDTLTLLDSDRQKHRIRLFGIDAPEIGQAHGTRAREALASKVFSQPVTVDVVDTDRYGRTVGKVHLGDRYINHELVAEGWAWQYRQHDRSPELQEAERQARERRLGLWRDTNPEPPWDYRRHEREHQSPRF